MEYKTVKLNEGQLQRLKKTLLGDKLLHEVVLHPDGVYEVYWENEDFGGLYSTCYTKEEFLRIAGE